MKKWLVAVVVALVLSSFFISLAVEKKSDKVTPTEKITIEKKLDKIMKQNESILEELKKIEEDLTFIKKELHIIKARA